jgi:CheY-like chemotaxis protein
LSSVSNAGGLPEKDVPSLDGVTVLLVESDPNARMAIAWTLERIGARVASADNGTEALARIESMSAQEPPLLVMISHLELPGMNGCELIERIAKQRRDRNQKALPCCAMSACESDIDRRRSLEAGFDLYLEMPLMPGRLAHAVEELRALAASRQ